MQMGDLFLLQSLLSVYAIAAFIPNAVSVFQCGFWFSFCKRVDNRWELKDFLTLEKKTSDF